MGKKNEDPRGHQTGRFEEGKFPVHKTKSPNRGSKIGTAILLLLLIGGGGGGYYFWSQRAQLSKHLEDRNPLATPAALALSFHADLTEEERTLLTKTLRDEQAANLLRKACARALGSTQSRHVVSVLGETATGASEPSLQVAAVKALAANGDSSAFRHLKQIFDDEDDVDVQAAACRAVGELDLTKLAPYLIERLSHVDTGVKHAALYGLEALLPEGHVSYGMNAKEWATWYDGQ